MVAKPGSLFPRCLSAEGRSPLLRVTAALGPWPLPSPSGPATVAL